MSDYTPAPLESDAEELAQASAALSAYDLADFRRMRDEDPLVAMILRALERSAQRRALYARHHPRPLPIDGHAYARRRRSRR